MAEADNQIPLGFKAGPSPLDMIGKLAPAAEALAHRDLIRQEVEGKAEMANIFSNNKDPQTGLTDYQAAIEAMGNNPKTAFMVPQVAREIADKELTNIKTLGEQLSQGMTRMGLIRNALAPLLLKKDAVKDTDLRGALIDLGATAQGVGLDKKNFPPLDSGNQVAIMSQFQGLTGPQISAKLKQMDLANQNAADEHQAMFGSLHEMDTGAVKYLLRSNDYGQTLLQAKVIKEMTPEERAQMQELQQPGGGVRQQTLGETVGVPPPGQGNGLSLGDGSGGLVPVAPQTPPPTNGLVGKPPAGPPPNALVKTPVAAGPKGPRVFGESPDVITQNSMEDFAKHMNEANQNVQSTADALHIVNNLEKELPNINTGGGGEFRADLGQHFQGVINAAKDAGLSEGTYKALQKVQEQISNGSLNSSQTARMYATMQVIKSLTASVAGQGRTMRPEVDTWLKNMANLDTDPKTFVKYLNNFKEIAKNDVDQQEFLANFAKVAADDPRAWKEFGQIWTKRQKETGYTNYDPIPLDTVGSAIPTPATDAAKKDAMRARLREKGLLP